LKNINFYVDYENLRLGSDIGPDRGTNLGSDIGTNLGSNTGPDRGTNLGSDIGPDRGTNLGSDTGPDRGTNYGTEGRLLKIFELIKADGKISIAMIVEATGIPRRTIARYISELKRRGVIVRQGNKKNGQWDVIDLK
jgi:hypothetical protein